MSTQEFSDLNQKLDAVLGGDRRAINAVYARMRPVILAIVRDRAPDLANDREDVLNEVFVLMMEAPHRFDPERGSVRSFMIAVLLPDAIRRVRAKMARAGATTRRRKVVEPVREPTFPMVDRIPAVEDVKVVGYGSQDAMEASCDLRSIWASSTPPLRLIIGGLAAGQTQAEIASALKLDRFKVVRTLKALRQLSTAAQPRLAN